MTEIINKEINHQLCKLLQAIQFHNKKVDLSGLFSEHVLKQVQECGIEWDTACDENWLESIFDERNVYHVAGLGYSIHIAKLDEKAEVKFVRGLDLLEQRDPFKGPHINYPFQPVAFLGLVLGTKCIKDQSRQKEKTKWLTGILNERIKKGELGGYQALLYKYIRHLLTGQKIEINDITEHYSLEELSVLEYFLKRNIFQTHNQDVLGIIRKELINRLVKSCMDEVIDEKAAIVWAAANESIAIEIDNLLVSPHFVSAILSRFEDAMKRWRYDTDSKTSPVQWPVNEEREVQDIVWLILRSYFDDLVDEERLPKFGHASYKPDFAIPSLRLLIEVKVAYSKDDFKKIEQAIMVDSIGYLINSSSYDKILVFIYDKSASVQEHNTTKRALKQIDKIGDVVIVSKPSQLP
ncbi:MAG: hypothetical protein ONB44_09950 [candidate division KSB1 bacterium]|nr:hypothetical protein [candidate division KSB1 bacterium]MDZ7302446.1 hypothetical protein [candidate division KSB1 bacterium]MDZ7311960.1 hypothetical protein [candidate division KSB1 bacterium]